ncbi:unnamed protein product [Rhodiola kirilowii]
MDPSFVCQHPVELTIIRNVSAVADNFIVNDVNGNLLFKVKDYPVAIHGLRVLLDRDENPVITLRKKIMTMHNQWQVFKGESKEIDNLLYTVKSNSMFKSKTELDIFLAKKNSNAACDFKVRGNWLERSCEVYAGETSSVIASMCRKEGVSKEKDELKITVHSDHDYVYIMISLVLILDKIDRDNAAAQQGSASADPVGIL